MGTSPLKISLQTPKTYGITLSGQDQYLIGMTSPIPFGMAKLTIDTSAHWAERADYIPQKGEIIVYSDRRIADGILHPGIKIGNGVDVVGDLPFLGDDIPITYAALPDKPQINGISLVGNITISQLIADGLIINGGDATGYDPPIIPTGVPYAEGVEF